MKNNEAKTSFDEVPKLNLRNLVIYWSSFGNANQFWIKHPIMFRDGGGSEVHLLP